MEKLSHFTDDVLVNLYVCGNNEAFNTLLERHQNKLFSYIYFWVHDQNLADDIFQETFIKAIWVMKQGRYQHNGRFLAWLMRIAHNQVVDYFRQEKKEQLVFQDDLQGELFSGNELQESCIEMHLIEEQTNKEIQQMIDMLPPSQREVVLMRYYQELSFKEIAEMLHISINTALGRMRYALINLRKMVACQKQAVAVRQCI